MKRTRSLCSHGIVLMVLVGCAGCATQTARDAASLTHSFATAYETRFNEIAEQEKELVKSSSERIVDTSVDIAEIRYETALREAVLEYRDKLVYGNVRIGELYVYLRDGALKKIERLQVQDEAFRSADVEFQKSLKQIENDKQAMKVLKHRLALLSQSRSEAEQVAFYAGFLANTIEAIEAAKKEAGEGQ